MSLRRIVIRRLVVLLAVLLAALTVVLLAEGGLRVAEMVALRSRDDMASEGVQTILAVGDSWTFGVESGDPATKSYPAQLQGLLDNELGRWRYRVINRGRPGMTSRALRQRLPRLLTRFKPSILVVLVGSTNFFNPLARQADAAAGDGSSPWERLKLVRLWKVMTAEGQAPRTNKEQVLHSGNVRLALRTAASRPMRGAAGPDDAQGLPQTSEKACANVPQIPTVMQAIRQAVPRGAAAVSEALQADPRCVRLLVHAADLCFARRDFTCARQFATRALKVEPAEPRAVVVLSSIPSHTQRPLPGPLMQQLERVTAAHPRFMRARRLKALALLQGEPTLCELKRELLGAQQSCPGCGWVAKMMKLFAKQVDSPGERALRADLTAIMHLSRRRRLKLLMLNYPRSDRDICGDQAQGVIARFARQHKVQIMEIGQVLGPLTTTRKSRFYATQDHPNAAGYGLLARRIQQRLVKLGWANNKRPPPRREPK